MSDKKASIPIGDKNNSSSSTQLVGNSSTSESSLEEAATISSSPPILSTPYPLEDKSAIFKKMYAHSIGYSIQAANMDSVKLRTSAARLQRTIVSLGFTKVDESMADCIVPEESKLNWALLTSKGTDPPSGPSYMIMKPFVSRMYSMCSKWQLVQSLRIADQRMQQHHQSFLTGSGNLFSPQEFIPNTINLNSPNLENDLASQPGVYLAKPARGSMGEHMQLVRIRSNRVQEDLLSFLLSSEFTHMHRSQVILQQYIERPLLIDKRKFDMRVYMLVVNPKRGSGTGDRPKQSGYFAFHHPGFIRLCSEPYDPEHADIAVHLTNQSIQAKKVDTFRRLKEVTTWYPDELNDYLNKRRRTNCKDWAKDVLYPKVGAILGYIAAVYRTHMDDRNCRTSTFRILGVDLLVDEKLRLYLLEFNELPAWGLQTSVLVSIKPNLWLEAISLVSEVAVRYKAYLPIDDEHLVTRQNFRLAYTSEDVNFARRNIAALY
ncbi:hypothetical protein BOX15_Mlig027127g3 [Macrostomum lignano]|uniref:Tubulin--tyrosine ligase-like protein 9 n=3 Tax=Macrostomum lignano TaxID=282301 RepID=A0A1I8GHN8_9PLAT|nr:hypothetical protein BOX15_Mlig027127g3 [Macrostomum lignano]